MGECSHYNGRKETMGEGDGQKIWTQFLTLLFKAKDFL